MTKPTPRYNSPDYEERLQYRRDKQREFSGRNKRLQFHLSKDEHKQLTSWYEKNKIQPSLPKQIRAIVMNTTIRADYLQSLTDMPDKKSIQDLTVVLRNMGNNLNQIATHLNTEALKQKRDVVADYEESMTILERSFSILRSAEDAIRNIISTYDDKP